MKGEIKIGDEFTVRKWATYAWVMFDGNTCLSTLPEDMTCRATYVFSSDNTIIGSFDGDKRCFFLSDCTKVATTIDYNQCLIDYMEAKAAAIAVQTGGKVRDFFLPEDAEDIRGWDAEKAVRQWRQVWGGFDNGWASRVCPFCDIRLRDKCKFCDYIKRHGKCYFRSQDNTWGRVIENMPELNSYASGFIYKYFTPDQQNAMKTVLEGK